MRIKITDKDYSYSGIRWDIGTYSGAGSICVNVEFKGKCYHWHDYGSLIPRFMRLGWIIERMQEISGYNAHVKQVHMQYLKNAKQ